MSTFFEINESVVKCIESLELAIEAGHGEMQDKLGDDLLSLLDTQTTKVDSYIGYIRHNEALVEMLSEEIDRLSLRKSSLLKRNDILLATTKAIMVSRGIKDIPGTNGRKFSLRESKYVDVKSLDLLPDVYKRTRIEPLKSELMTDLRAGVSIPGATVGTRTSVVIK